MSSPFIPLFAPGFKIVCIAPDQAISEIVETASAAFGGAGALTFPDGARYGRVWGATDLAAAEMIEDCLRAACPECQAYRLPRDAAWIAESGWGGTDFARLIPDPV